MDLRLMASALLLVACTTESEANLGTFDASTLDAGTVSDAAHDAEHDTFDAGVDVGPSLDAGAVTRTGLPPISGGTLAVIGERVVVGDPDRDMIWVYDLRGAPRLEHRIELPSGSEPGRVVGMGDEALVVLRGTGRIARVDLDRGFVNEEREVCGAPRGVDVVDTRILVACAGGSLVSMAGAEWTRRFIEPGLRDVIAADGVIYVSVFRSAEVLVLNEETLELIERLRPPSGAEAGVPNTAWRMRADPDGGVRLLHQRSTEAEVQVMSTGYSGSPRCGPGGVVDTALSHIEAGRPVALGPTMTAFVLTVDMALAGDGVVFASAGAHQFVRTTGIRRVFSLAMDEDCVTADYDSRTGGVPMTSIGLIGDRVVAWQRSGELRVLDGDAVQVVSTGAPIVVDAGRDLFHQGTSSFVACASCHPEGDDDSITWNFVPTVRRTQSLRGGLSETAPFHWSGDQEDMSDIMQGAFVERMQGSVPTEEQTMLIAEWIDTLPSLTSSATPDAALVSRGQALFDGDAACAGCHAGSHFTDNRSVDVGGGEAFQVPSLLGIATRGPFLHDGSAPTLREALVHGGEFTASEEDALVAYLTTL
ncbi:MAG: hypothetical protein AB8H86_21605 [Polyangiales bacterium]